MGKVRSNVFSENMLFDSVIACDMTTGVSVGGGEGMSRMQVLRCSRMKGSRTGQGPKETGNKNSGGKLREVDALEVRHVISRVSGVENEKVLAGQVR